MSTSTTTVHKTRTRPARFVIFGTDGTTPVTGGTVPMNSSNNNIANPTLDPADSRRCMIAGVNQGTADVTIGSGPGALVITVTVSAPPDLSHVDLVGYDDEI